MGVVYHVHEAFPQKPDLKHLIPAQTASAVPAVLFLPSVHFLPAPSGHPYLAQVPLSLILQFLLQSFLVLFRRLDKLFIQFIVSLTFIPTRWNLSKVINF